MPGPAKLVRPDVGRIVARPRLFKMLQRPARAVWIWGPPGCGKTALVSSYLAQRKGPQAWYQIDRGDADLATIIHNLGVLRARWRPGSPPSPVGLAGALDDAVHRAFTRLWNAAPAGFVLVFDDWHELPTAAPLQSLWPELLASVPEGRRLVVTSRSGPGASVARLRAAGHLISLGWADLRLTPREARMLVRGRGIRSSRLVDALTTRADGWAAGLCLLAEVRPDPNVREPGASGTGLFEYLAAEMLARLSAADRAALLSLALVPAFTESLAAELAGAASATRLAAATRGEQYFIERRAGSPAIYQFHPLFRDFLRARAEQAVTAEVAARARRTGARHLLEIGSPDEAARLLVEAEAWDELEKLVTAKASSLVARGCEQTVLGWLKAVPDSVAAARPWMSFWLAVAGSSLGFPTVRGHLGRAIDLFDKKGHGTGLALSLAQMLDTYFLEWGRFRDIDPWLDKADEHIEHTLARGEPLIGRLAVSAFRAFFYRRPDHRHVPWLRERLHAIREQPDNQDAIAAGLALSSYYSWIDDPARALALAQAAQDGIRTANASTITRQLADHLEALAALKLGDGAGCLRVAQRGLDRGRESGVHALDFRLHSMAVYGAMVLRDDDLTARHLGWMRDRLNGVPMIDVGFYHFQAGWEAAVRGDLHHGYQHARSSLALGEEAGLPLLVACASFLLAQLSHQRGDAEGARAQVARVRDITTRMGAESSMFMSGLLDAELCFASDDAAAGEALLRDTLRRGREGMLGYCAFWRPTFMARVCARALERGIEVDYVRALVRGHALTLDVPPLDIPNWPWPLEVRALGALSITVDGAPLHFTGKAQQRPLELLRALIALGARRVPMSDLIDGLWPDAPGDAARATLDVTLLRLRRLLGRADAVVVEEGHLSLDDRHSWLDVWHLERLLNEAEQARRRGASHVAADVLARTIALYRGPLLTDVGDAWVLAPRERLRRRIVHALEASARALESGHEVEPALSLYLCGLDVDDLAEGLYQGATRCYRALGRSVEAAALEQRWSRMREARLGDA
ncbi:MAG: BTAD domain-containing putative transcriptional regulator [Candidatus Rokuibacteriota bacterium]